MNPCGKYYFVSEQEGTRKMATMPPSRDPDYRLNVYYCTRCEGFHIGHTQAKVETATASCGGSA